MKRLAMPVAAVLAAGLVGLCATSFLIDGKAVRQSVEAQLRAATGLDLVVNGDVYVSVFPGSYVTLRDVGLKSGAVRDEPLAIDELTAHLRLLPLLLHRYEIADVVLTNPRVNVTHDAQNQSNWKPLIETLARTIKPGPGSSVSFSEIRLIDGVVTYRNAAGEITDVVSDIDLSLGWPSISSSFAATGQFDWRGQRIDGSLSIGDFVAALSGEKSVLKIRAAAAPLKFAFDGTIASRTSLLMEGTVTADSASLRDVLRWAGQPALVGGGGLGRFALKARANAVGEAVALTNVNVELDGNTAEGVISFTRGERPMVQATLAADAIDFTPYASTIRLIAGGARDWNRQPFDLSGLSVTDIDMRLSAAKANVGPTKIGRTAIGANLRNGTLTFSVGEAQIHGGILKGSLSVKRADTVANVKAQLQFTDVDLSSSSSELFGIRNLSGRGNINVVLEASGASPYALTQSLDGTASLTGRDGAISGFNVEQLLKRLERRPLSGAGNFRSGSTPFSKLNIVAKIDNGIATTDDAVIEGPTARLTLSGSASVPAREFDLKGMASLISAPDTAPSFQLPFVIQGPWDDPLVFPDSDALIRRSPASAPLLDSLKDRKTRDAVKSVIDRFTGLRKAPAQAPVAAETPATASPTPADVSAPAPDAPVPEPSTPAPDVSASPAEAPAATDNTPDKQN